MHKLIIPIFIFITFNSCGIKIQADNTPESLSSNSFLINLELTNRSLLKKNLKGLSTSNLFAYIKENEETDLWTKSYILGSFIPFAGDISETEINARSSLNLTYILKSNFFIAPGNYPIEFIYFPKKKRGNIKDEISNKKLRRLLRKGISTSTTIKIPPKSKSEVNAVKWIKNNSLEQLFSYPKMNKITDKKLFEEFILKFPESNFINTAKFLYAKSVYFNYINEDELSKKNAGNYLLELARNKSYFGFFAYEINSYSSIFYKENENLREIIFKETKN